MERGGGRGLNIASNGSCICSVDARVVGSNTGDTYNPSPPLALPLSPPLVVEVEVEVKFQVIGAGGICNHYIY